VTNDEAFAAAAQADAVKLFQLSATVLEAKRWAHPLDRLSASETPGWFPSQQIQDYLNHAKDATGRRFFDWAILTNGSEWRLYSEKSAVGAHFSFHLVRDGQVCSLDDCHRGAEMEERAFGAGQCLTDPSATPPSGD
jgi:hypothetical protein